MGKRKNFSGVPFDNKELMALLAEPAKFEGYNFAMPEPLEIEGVKIGQLLMKDEGEGYTFVDCNFVNRLPPPKAQYGGTINSTLRESQIKIGEDSYKIDGETIYIGIYVDIVYGKHGHLFPTPKEYPCEGPED